MLDSIKELVGDQTPNQKDEQGNFFVHFMIVDHKTFKSNKFGGTHFSIEKQKIKDGDGFEFFVDTLKSLPENTSNYTPQELGRHIMKDTRLGVGKEYPELGIVAVSRENSPMAKPLVSYVDAFGKTRYIKHPMFNEMVRKI